jgi:hypothetical protein
LVKGDKCLRSREERDSSSEEPSELQTRQESESPSKLTGRYHNNKNIEASSIGTHNVGAVGDGRPEQRRGVDEMVKGHRVPTCQNHSQQIIKSKSLNWEERIGDRRGMQMMENVIYLFVRGVLGAEHVRRRCRAPKRQPLLKSTTHLGGLIEEREDSRKKGAVIG